MIRRLVELTIAAGLISGSIWLAALACYLLEDALIQLCR